MELVCLSLERKTKKLSVVGCYCHIKIGSSLRDHLKKVCRAKHMKTKKFYELIQLSENEDQAKSTVLLGNK